MRTRFEINRKSNLSWELSNLWLTQIENCMKKNEKWHVSEETTEQKEENCWELNLTNNLFWKAHGFLLKQQFHEYSIYLGIIFSLQLIPVWLLLF